jgi:hypothetical protein
MKSKSSLTDFLREKAEHADTADHFDWEERKNKWLKGIENLYSLIKKWLKSLEEEGKINYIVSKKKIQEDYYDPYEIEILVIVVGKQKIELLPKGTLIVGAEGRVDVRGPNGLRSLIFVNNEWLTVEKREELDVVPFNQKSFKNILKEIME